MRTSESLDEIFTALSIAQSEIKGALKDAENPFFRSNYADLEAVWEAVRIPLCKNGLSVIQTTGHEEGKLVLCTRLAHASGQWVEGTTPILMAKQDPQSMGSAISYARRYALAAMVGVYQTDDDGEGAMGRDLPKPAKTAQELVKPKTATQLPAEQRDLLLEAMAKWKWKHADVQNLSRILYSTSNIPSLKPEQVQELTMLVASGTVDNITDAATKERGEIWNG